MELFAVGEAKAGRVSLVKDFSAVILLTILPAFFFWRFLTPNAADAVSFPAGDFTNLHYPYRLFETRELLQGRLPLWNPYVFGGTSSLGDIQYGIFYPLNIISSLLLGRDGLAPIDLTVQVTAHFSLAGILTYLLARRVLKSRSGAIVSALVFTYSGYLTSFPVQQVIVLQTSIWLPAILLFLDKGIGERSLSSFAIAGIFTAVAISVGHPQTFAYVFVGISAYAAFRTWTAIRNGRGVSARGSAADRIRVDWRTVVFGLVLFLAIAFGLAGAQLVPSFEHLQLTERMAVDYEYVERGFPLRESAGLLFPTMSGGKFMYVGILPLLLAFVAFLSPRERQQKIFWLVLGCFTLLFSFGGQTFLHAAAYMIVPGFKFFRDQERIIFLFAFAIAVLSGYGARAVGDELVNSDFASEMRRRLAVQTSWLRWGALLILAFGLAAFLSYAGATGEQKASLGELSDRAFLTLVLFAISVIALHLSLQGAPRTYLSAALLISIILFDLFSTNWRNNVGPARPEGLFPLTKTISRIKADRAEMFRISSEGLLPGHGSAGSVYEIEDIVGDSPLELRQHRAFEKNVEEIRRWQLLNVKYVLTKRKFNDDKLIPVMQEDQINVYELAPNLRLPRAFIVHRAVVAQSNDEEFRAIKSMDPRAEVVLPKAPPLPLPGEPSSGSTATIVERRSDRIELRTLSTANGLLVLSEVFYPGWKAFVDGQPVEVLRANYLLRAVPVEKGSHRVDLVYDPPSLRSGAIVSGASALIALAAMLFPATRLLLLATKTGQGE